MVCVLSKQWSEEGDGLIPTRLLPILVLIGLTLPHPQDTTHHNQHQYNNVLPLSPSPEQLSASPLVRGQKLTHQYKLA